MRAGSLSDPRVVAILRKYFVSVHVPELCTASLIRDPKDEVLLREWDAGLRSRGKGGLYGGVREVMTLLDGTPFSSFSVLNQPGLAWSDRKESQRLEQYVPEGRSNPNGAVLRWFRHAEDCLCKAHGSLPEDWAKMLDGTAPEVRAVREEATAESGFPFGVGGFRVSVRNSALMYRDLVGSELMALRAEQASQLMSSTVEIGATRAWPESLVLDLCRRFYPRGQVHTELTRESVSGSVVATITKIEGDKIMGRLSGKFALEPGSKAEVSKRANAAHLFESRGELFGDFTLDRESRRLRSLRLASKDVEHAVSTTMGPGFFGKQTLSIAVEWIEPKGRAR